MFGTVTCRPQRVDRVERLEFQVAATLMMPPCCGVLFGSGKLYGYGSAGS